MRGPQPLTAHGFYSRTLVDVEFGELIHVRRRLCRCCRRAVSLLPQFALPCLRFTITVIALFLIAWLLGGSTLIAAAMLPHIPYQRGQFWVRRFSGSGRTLMHRPGSAHRPTIGASLRLARALLILQSIGWVTAHRFLFVDLRFHLLGRQHFSLQTGDSPRSVPRRPPLEEKHIAFAWSPQPHRP